MIPDIQKEEKEFFVKIRKEILFLHLIKKQAPDRFKKIFLLIICKMKYIIYSYIINIFVLYV